MTTCIDIPGLPDYKSETIVTYAYYDTKFAKFIQELGVILSRDAVEEFENDYDITNYVYAEELLCVLGVSVTDKIEDKCDTIYNYIENTPLGECLDMLTNKSLVLFANHTPSSSSSSSSSSSCGSSNDDDNATYPMSSEKRSRRMACPLLFSYDLFFLTHQCIRELALDGHIKEQSISRLMNAIDTFL